MKFIVYSKADGETEKCDTLSAAIERAEIIAENLRDAGANDNVQVWREDEPDNVLYHSKG